MTYAKYFNAPVPPTQPIPGRESEMKLNPAGGYGFTTESWKRLNRFLMLGSEGGSYYEGEKKLTIDNAKNLRACITEDGKRVVREATQISLSGSAPKNAPAIFALAAAMVFGDLETRQAAGLVLPDICRTGTDLFEFLETFIALRGKGRSLSSVPRKAITAWFTRKDPKSLAYAVTKYASREGWSQKDVLRLAHIATHEDPERAAVLAYALGKPWIQKKVLSGDSNDVLEYLSAVEYAKNSAVADINQLPTLIRTYNLPREVIPTEQLNSKRVWEALLEKMPYTAMMRNLPKLTELGLLDPFSSTQRHVMDTLADSHKIKNGRVHPLSILLALKTYASGVSLRGSKTWTPVAQVIDALDAAFYASFDNIEPITENILVALDLSGSMQTGAIAGVPLRPIEAEAAMAMCFMKAAPNAVICGYATTFELLKLSPRQRLDDIVAGISRVHVGYGTDCSLPFVWAKQRKLEIDAFMMFTDSMGWAGEQHPSVARNKYSPTARWALVQTTATDTGIQDPKDMNSLEFSGFSPSMYTLLGSFIHGEL